MENIQNGDKVVSTRQPDLNNGFAFEVVNIENGIATAQINGDKVEFPLEDLKLVTKHESGFLP